MRVGVFGGTFDPIHIGHLALAEQCREQCRLDEVWFVPAAQPPHKDASLISPANVRRDMVEFAIAGNSAFRVSTVELDREGPSFTVTTLEQLQSESRDLFLLVGADSLKDLAHWRQPARILELATVVAVNRGDQPLPEIPELRAVCGDLIDSRVMTIEMPGIDLSATDIRARCGSGRSIRYLVPRAVEVFIEQQGLYRNAASLE